jgi:hypothetical protein
MTLGIASLRNTSNHIARQHSSGRWHWPVLLPKWRERTERTNPRGSRPSGGTEARKQRGRLPKQAPLKISLLAMLSLGGNRSGPSSPYPPRFQCKQAGTQGKGLGFQQTANRRLRKPLANRLRQGVVEVMVALVASFEPPRRRIRTEATDHLLRRKPGVKAVCVKEHPRGSRLLANCGAVGENSRHLNRV